MTSRSQKQIVGGRTLWQIFWDVDGDEGDQEVSMLDISDGNVENGVIRSPSDPSYKYSAYEGHKPGNPFREDLENGDLGNKSQETDNDERVIFHKCRVSKPPEETNSPPVSPNDSVNKGTST